MKSGSKEQLTKQVGDVSQAEKKGLLLDESQNSFLDCFSCP